MRQVQDGQCGRCRYFGEEPANNEELAQIRATHQAREDYLTHCRHPKHADLHLKVTPLSGCDGFEPITEAAEAA